MPVYPFRCKDCGKTSEVLCSVKDYEELKKHVFCVHCKSGNVARLFTPCAIHGFEWNYMSRGYHPERDDPANEVRYDMKKLEQKATETHNLKEYYDKKKALEYFAEAHEDILT